MDSQHTPLHLVYASDANYVHIVEMAIASACVLASRPNDLIVHVLDCGIPDEMWECYILRDLRGSVEWLILWDVVDN